MEVAVLTVVADRELAVRIAMMRWAVVMARTTTITIRAEVASTTARRVTANPTLAVATTTAALVTMLSHVKDRHQWKMFHANEAIRM